MATGLNFAVFLFSFVALADAVTTHVRVRILSRHHPKKIIVTTGEKSTVISVESKLPVTFEEGELSISVPEAKLNRSYAGRLTVSSSRNELVVINTVPLDDYVVSVTLSEMGWAPQEAMAAQAALARTWTLTHLSPKASFDFDDLTHNQSYQGVFPQTPATRRFLTDKRVLKYSGSPIKVVYHGVCGERVHSAKEVWGNEVPYLVSLPLPEKVVSRSPASTWTRLFDKRKLAETLDVKDSLAVWVSEIADGRSGVRVGSRWIPIDEFRLGVGRSLGWNQIRSNEFVLEDLGGQIKLTGKGLGHNVGLCQREAIAMAELGWRFPDILSYFYPGTKLD